MKKEDLRTKRTKKALKNAVIKLLESELFEKISVTDICREANVNRVTFYTHYNDKYELLYELTSDLNKSLEEYYSTIYSQIQTGDFIKDFTHVISHAVYKLCFENKRFIESLSKSENKLFIETIEESIVREGLKLVDTVGKDLKYKFPPKFMIKFLLGGFSKIVFEYALTESNLSEQEFFEYFDKLFYSILKSQIFFE